MYEQGTKERTDSHERSAIRSEEGSKNPNPRSVWVAAGSRKMREEEREKGKMRDIGGEGSGPSPTEGLGQAHEKIKEIAQGEKRKDKGKEIMEVECDYSAGKCSEETRNLQKYGGEVGQKNIVCTNARDGEGVHLEGMEALGIQPSALGSLVKTDVPFGLGNFQEVIANAMKEAMATQLNDWFGAGHGKGLALTARNQERMGEVEK